MQIEQYIGNVYKVTQKCFAITLEEDIGKLEVENIIVIVPYKTLSHSHQPSFTLVYSQETLLGMINITKNECYYSNIHSLLSKIENKSLEKII